MAKMSYNPPPNWPAPPAGWSPEPGWQPDPAWGPPPQGWNLYKDPRNWFMRHKILTGVLGLLLLGIIGSAANGSSGSTTTSDTSASTASSTPVTQPSAAPPAPAPKPAPKMATLNQRVRDGNFEFTVKSIKCGIAQVGDSAFGQKAQGQFCFVKLHVLNIGQDARMLDGSSQSAFDAQNRKFDADAAAAMYLGQDAQTFINNINPGNAVDGTVIFDVPKNVKITQLELHDSAFSGGVKVRVG